MNTLIKVEMEDVFCDLLYAKDTNFTTKKIYQSGSVCFLHKDALKTLELAAKMASKLGYKIKIVDAFRPIEVQQILWNAYPDENFISNPAKKHEKLGHCRGASVDLTLVDGQTNLELPMGSPIDYFGKKSYLNSINMHKEEFRNRMILIGIMTSAGFETIKTEWWHFNLPNMLCYPIIKHGLKYIPIS